MNESTRDLINIQELFESAGPQIFLPNFDTQSYLASIRNSEGALVIEDFNFAPYVPREYAFSLSESDSTFGLLNEWYDTIEAFELGYFDTLKVSTVGNFYRTGEAFSAKFDGASYDDIYVYGDFPNVNVGDVVFGPNGIDGYLGGTVGFDEGVGSSSDFSSDLGGFSEALLWVPPREFAAGKTYVSTGSITPMSDVDVIVWTHGGDDIIGLKQVNNGISFANGGEGTDTVTLDGGLLHFRAFGDFLLVNSSGASSSHILFDIERVQSRDSIIPPGGGVSPGFTYETFNVPSGPSIDGGMYKFYEDLYTAGDNKNDITPLAIGETYFIVPDSVDQYSSSSVSDFTIITKNFEDLEENAKDNRRSFELKGSFSYSGSNGYDSSGGLVELPEISGRITQSDEYFGEVLISTERPESSLYSDWPFQNKYFSDGAWRSNGFDGNDALISLNGIANDGWDINEGSGLDFYTGLSDTIYGYGGNDYIFGGKGDDIIDGGDGNDVAIYQGARDGYSITDNGDGTYTISDSSGKDGTDRLSNIESLSFADQDLGLGSNEMISTITTSTSLRPISTEGIDVYDFYDSFRSGLSSAPKLPSLMDAASSGVSSPSSTTSSTDATGSSVGGSTSTDSSDSGISAETVSFVPSAANEKFTAAAGKVKMKMDMRKEDFSISKVGDSGEWSITGTGIGTDTLSGYKRLEFEDGVLALDTDPGDTAGQAYRLYQAAFARTPDMPGVAYHMNDMESNGLSVVQIARNFIASPEFRTQYGEDPTEDEYINLLYQNVLGRTPGQFEIDYYKERFESGTTDWNTTLVFFAESPENVSLVAPQIEDGIWMPF